MLPNVSQYESDPIPLAASHRNLGSWSLTALYESDLPLLKSHLNDSASEFLETSQSICTSLENDMATSLTSAQSQRCTVSVARELAIMYRSVRLH